MKIFSAIIILFFGACNDAIAQISSFKWAKGMGGSGSAKGYDVISDKQGNVYTTGHFRGSVDFDPGLSVYELTSAGGSDIFISKLDSSGNFVWAKSIGNSTDQQGYKIALDGSGNVYTTGFFVGTVDFDPGPAVYDLSNNSLQSFILKLDKNGNFIWAKAVGNYAAYSLAVDGTANVFITGMFNDTQDFDPGTGVYNLSTLSGPDAFVLKLDQDGNFGWAKRIGNDRTDKSYGICVDVSGNVYVTGVLGTYSYALDPVDFALDQSGFDFNDSLFITKLDKFGNTQWIKYLAGDSTAEAKAIAVDASGNIYTTGRFLGNVDFDPGLNTFNLHASGFEDLYISKLDPSGNFVWAKKTNGPAGGFPWNNSTAIAVDNGGNIYTTGFFGSSMDFDPGTGNSIITTAGNFDIFISKIDSSGKLIWASGIGGTSLDYGIGISSDSKNNVYITGTFNGTTDFDPGNGIYNMVSASGFGTIFVLKLGNPFSPLPVPVPFPIVDSSCRIDINTRIYPNPFSNTTFMIDKAFTSCQVSMNIYNMTGQLIMKNRIIQNGHNELSLSNFSAGVYVYEFFSGNKVLSTGSFVKL